MTISDSLEIALTLMDVLKEIGVNVGDVVPDQKLKEGFRARGLDLEEITRGLKYAHGQDWLEYDRVADVFLLTQAGFEIA